MSLFGFHLDKSPSYPYSQTLSRGMTKGYGSVGLPLGHYEIPETTVKLGVACDQLENAVRAYQFTDKKEEFCYPPLRYT